MTLYGQLSGRQTIRGNVCIARQPLTGSLAVGRGITPPLYTGAQSITPAMTAQRFPTNGFFLETDLIVQPIPSQFGLISYDGSSITVS